MKIIHIGLGKSYSSTFKNIFYPYLCDKYSYLFNPEEFLKIMRENYIYSNEDKILLSEKLNNNNVLIASESLVNWVPSNWVKAADRNVDLFGSDANIIINLRDTHQYLTSLYLQMIHEGNIISPNVFFCTPELYKKYKPFLSEESLQRFDSSSLDYEFLVSIYKKRFKNVYVVNHDKVLTLYPWNVLFNMDNDDKEKILFLIRKAPRYNKSYSRISIKLTFILEKIFSFIGFKSRGSQDIEFQTQSFIKIKKLNVNYISNFDIISKNLLRKIFKNWRWWMQNFVNKVLTYKKYKLPNNVYIDNKILDKNRLFLEKINQKIIDN